MVTLSRTAQTLLRLPLMEAGDHPDQATFHGHYKAMPPAFRAELIGEVVLMPSPLSWEHTVMDVLRQGLATPEQATFVQQLQERRATPSSTLLQT